ncbi:MAG: hypothetical protein PVI96_16220, partial [Desulfobacterales bacterium]
MIKDPNPKTLSQACDLCGLPLRYGTVSAAFSGNTYAFCCNGCRQVFTILMEATDSTHPETFRETELFKQCQAKGIIPRTEKDLIEAQRDVGSGSDSLQPDAAMAPAPVVEDNMLTLKLIIGNM